MKGTIAVVFLALSGLSAVAMLTRPGSSYPDRLELVRTTDANPNRNLEAERFAKLNPKLAMGIDVGSNRLEKIIVQSSSGVGPDMFDTYGGAQLQTYVESGIAYDVTEPAKAMGFSLADTWPAARGELSANGKQYSYPGNVNVDILIYNKETFDKAKVAYPKQNMTWDEFFALAKKLTHGSGASRVYGVAPMNYGYFFQTQRGEIFSPDGTRLLVKEKPMQRAFQLYHDLIFKYKVAPSSLDMKAMSGQGGWGSGSINQFTDGRFAMVMIGKWALINFRNVHTDQKARFEAWQKAGSDEKTRPPLLRLGSVVLPHFAGEKPAYGVSARSVAINALGKNRTEALQFLKFLGSKDYAQIVNEAVDALPGNPKYANVGLSEGEPDLSEMEMHRNTIKSMEFGYQRGRSPFLLLTDVERVLNDQISRMEADPSVSIPSLLVDAQAQLESLMQRNLDRDPKLRQKYKELTGSDRVGGTQ